MLGDVVSEEAVTKVQTFAQQLQNLERKPRRRRRDFLDQVPTTRQQMIQTALVKRLQKPVIDFPPVVMQPSLPVRPQYRRRFFEAAAWKYVVDRNGFRDHAHSHWSVAATRQPVSSIQATSACRTTIRS